MATDKFTTEKAELLLGRKPKGTELKLIQIFGDDAKYRWYKDDKGNLAASKTGRDKSFNK